MNFVFLVGFVAKRYYFSHSSPVVPASASDRAFADMWNQSRQSLLELLPIDSSDIVFVGNSITEGFPLQEMFHSAHIKNRGIGDNQSIHILGRIRGIARARPKKIFLELGLNDIRNGVSADTLLANYQAVLSAIREESERTEIFVQSVFPAALYYKGLEPAIESFNARLAVLSHFPHGHFLNIFPLLCKDGFLDSALTCDGVHLKGKGYMIWRDALLPYVGQGEK